MILCLRKKNKRRLSKEVKILVQMAKKIILPGLSKCWRKNQQKRRENKTLKSPNMEQPQANLQHKAKQVQVLVHLPFIKATHHLNKAQVDS